MFSKNWVRETGPGAEAVAKEFASCAGCGKEGGKVDDGAAAELFERHFGIPATPGKFAAKYSALLDATHSCDMGSTRSFAVKVERG